MTTKTLCRYCSTEYDCFPCPACTVVVKLRTAGPPYVELYEMGYLAFEQYGERFAVTRIVGGLDRKHIWRVTHVATGTALPGTEALKKKRARANGLAVLAQTSEEKLKAEIERAKAVLAKSESYPAPRNLTIVDRNSAAQWFAKRPPAK